MTFSQRPGRHLQHLLPHLCKYIYFFLSSETVYILHTNVRMIHGFGEHIARYDRMFSIFVSQGIECYGYDQRGWGETGKKSNQFGNNQG